MNYSETLEYLFTSTPSFQQVGADAYKPGLERIEDFCHYLGSPHKNFPTIHIAGTNGKGSTSHLIASVLMKAGYRVGLFTSPHLKDFRERMRVDGQMISEQEVVEFVARNREKMEALQLSFFEMTTAMAFDHFSRCDVEVAVIETGLGGRLDATNILRPMVSVVTNVGMDHTDLLGNTLKQIATEKAGIAKPRTALILGERSEEYDSVFADRAAALQCPLIFAEEHFTADPTVEGGYTLRRKRDGREFALTLDLKGNYQQHNLVTAAAALDYLHTSTPLTIPRRAFIEGVESAATTTYLAGRWQQLQQRPTVICDTGHNSHGIKYVARQLSELQQSHQRLICVIGFVRDKDVRQVLELMPREAHYIFTAPATQRALPAEELARLATLSGLCGEVCPTATEALAEAKKIATAYDAIFIGGSNYLVAEII